jgi:hypothetical protein
MLKKCYAQLKEEQLRRIGKKSKSKTIKKYVQLYNTERIQKDLGYLSSIQFLKINLFFY